MPETGKTEHLLNRNEETLIEYLKAGLKQGRKFFKSRYIARDLGMTPKEVGLYLKKLSIACAGLRVEAWAYSKSTTWYVELLSGGP